MKKKKQEGKPGKDQEKTKRSNLRISYFILSVAFFVSHCARFEGEFGIMANQSSLSAGGKGGKGTDRSGLE